MGMGIPLKREPQPFRHLAEIVIGRYDIVAGSAGRLCHRIIETRQCREGRELGGASGHRHAWPPGICRPVQTDDVVVFIILICHSSYALWPPIMQLRSRCNASVQKFTPRNIEFLP